jgi:RNA polymerase sigma factor (sigma-70 family)
MIAYNEQELIYLYHLGSMRAYEILLSEYRKFIYAYANRYDSGIEYSEDSLQEMMISLFHAFEAYRIDKNTSMRTYFFYVIKSSLSTKKRMVYRKIRYLDDKKKISLDQNIYGTSIKVENVIADTKKTYRPECQLEIQNREQISLDILEKKASPLEKEVVYYLQLGYKFKEIAEILGVDIKCIYNAHYRLRKKVRCK